MKQPLDGKKLESATRQPCSTLTSAQVDTLGLNPTGKFIEGDAGPMCEWSNTEAGSSASVYFPVEEVIYEGLSQLYETHNRDHVEDYFFRMQDVSGFPLIASAAADARDLGSCGVQVGLTNRRVAYVDVTISREKRGQLDPCEKARDVAEMAVTTMKGGA